MKIWRSLRQVSFGLLCLGFGFWLNDFTTTIMKGNIVADSLLPRGHSEEIGGQGGSCRCTGAGASGSSLSALETASSADDSGKEILKAGKGGEVGFNSILKPIQKHALSVYDANEKKRERSFGKGGIRLKKLKAPRRLSKTQLSMWHPSAFTLEYFRPVYPCWGEERIGAWSEEGRWVCRPNSLTKDSVVYAIGSDGVSQFELELFHRMQPEIHVFNPFLTGPVLERMSRREEFRFHSIGISSKDTNTHRTLKKMMQDNGHLYVDVLKLSCNGCESIVMDSIFADLSGEEIPIGQIIVDVHNVMVRDRLQHFLYAMEHHGFRIFHLEQNWRAMNVIHFSFIHRSLFHPEKEIRNPFL